MKTLKVGSTMEEKLDFLSEAEVMKRFEHKNVVKLLGVCTKNEPVYTVMEFMLYGKAPCLSDHCDQYNARCLSLLSNSMIF